MRRAVHTLKGDSAACGYRELSELAHELEDVLTPELAQENAGLIAEVVLTAADTFHEMLAAYRNNLQPPAGGALREYMQRLLRKPMSGRAEKSLREEPASSHGPNTNDCMIAEAFRRGETVYQRALCISVAEALSSRGGLRTGPESAGRRRENPGSAGLKAAPKWYSGGLLEAALSSTKPADWIRKRCQVPSVVAQISVNRMPVDGDGARATCWTYLIESEAAAVSAGVAENPADAGADGGR